MVTGVGFLLHYNSLLWGRNISVLIVVSASLHSRARVLGTNIVMVVVTARWIILGDVGIVIIATRWIIHGDIKMVLEYWDKYYDTAFSTDSQCPTSAQWGESSRHLLILYLFHHVTCLVSPNIKNKWIPNIAAHSRWDYFYIPVCWHRNIHIPKDQHNQSV
jgi:hypothetical protein